MSEPNTEAPKRTLAEIARIGGRFLREWALLVGVGMAVSIAIDAAWSLFKPETAEGALLKLREGFVPWAATTFVALAVYKFLKVDLGASFNPPP